MIFQTFDDKEICTMVYKNGRFYDSVSPGCTKTWAYANHLRGKDIEYASIYALSSQQTLSELCPVGKKSEFESIQKRIKAVLKSSQNVGLNLEEICIYDLI